MKNLNQLLERFRGSLDRDSVNKEIIINSIEQITAIKLEKENINIKDGVLEIISTPSKKNEIKIKEEVIINSLKSIRGIYINKIFYK